MSPKFDEVIRRMEAAPARSLVVPVRITAHGEDATVIYGYGGLVYEPPENPGPPIAYVSPGDLMLIQDNAYVFQGGRLKTDSYPTNGRVKLLNNQIYDTSKPDNWLPPNYQSFLVNWPQVADIKIGWASRPRDLANRRLILRIAHGSWPQIAVADIELDERAGLLMGLGSLYAATAAIWTISFLDTLPLVGNELN